MQAESMKIAQGLNDAFSEKVYEFMQGKDDEQLNKNTATVIINALMAFVVMQITNISAANNNEQQTYEEIKDHLDSYLKLGKEVLMDSNDKT